MNILRIGEIHNVLDRVAPVARHKEDLILLLLLWAWCSKKRPDLKIPGLADRQSITLAFTALMQLLRGAGCRGEAHFPMDILEMNLTGAQIADVIGELSELKWNDLAHFWSDIEVFFNKQLSLKELRLPHSLTELLSRIAAINIESVIVSHANAIGVLTQIQNYSELSFQYHYSTLYHEIMAFLAKARPQVVDVFSSDVAADVIISAPPFAVKLHPDNGKAYTINRSEFVDTDRVWKHSKKRGILLLPVGVLFAQGVRGREFRESLINENAIAKVIQLPPNTLIGTALASVILVLEHGRSPRDPVIFVDAGRLDTAADDKSSLPLHRRYPFWEELGRVLEMSGAEKGCVGIATIDQIRENDFDLSVHLYLESSTEKAMAKLGKTQPLEEIAELIRCQLLEKTDLPDPNEEPWYEISSKDINERGGITLQTPAKLVYVSQQVATVFDKQKLQPNDIVLVDKGNVGMVALVGSNASEKLVAGQVCHIIRLTEGSPISAEYLYRYLASPLAQQRFEELSTGNVIKTLRSRDIRSFPIPVPTAKEQRKVTDTHQLIQQKYKIIDDVKAEIDALKNSLWAS